MKNQVSEHRTRCEGLAASNKTSQVAPPPFKLFSMKRTFYEAKKFCESKGGHLPEARSPTDEFELRTLMAKHHIERVHAGIISPPPTYQAYFISDHKAAADVHFNRVCLQNVKSDWSSYATKEYTKYHWRYLLKEDEHYIHPCPHRKVDEYDNTLDHKLRTICQHDPNSHRNPSPPTPVTTLVCREAAQELDTIITTTEATLATATTQLRKPVATAPSRVTRGAAAMVLAGSAVLASAALTSSLLSQASDDMSFNDLLALANEHAEHFDHNDAQIRELSASLEDVATSVNNMVRDLQVWVSNVVFRSDMDRFKQAIQATASRIDHAILQFWTLVADSAEGRTTVTILPSTTLKNLQSSILHDHGIPVTDKHDEIYTRIIIKNGTVFVIHQLETTDTKREAELYQLQPLPTYLDSNYSIHPVSPTHHVAILLDSHSHAFLDDREFTQCLTAGHPCHASRPLHNQASHCSIRQFFHLPYERCQYSEIADMTLLLVTYPGTTIYSLPSTAMVHVNCPRRPATAGPEEVLDLKMKGVIHSPAGCSLLLPTFGLKIFPMDTHILHLNHSVITPTVVQSIPAPRVGSWDPTTIAQVHRYQPFETKFHATSYRTSALGYVLLALIFMCPVYCLLVIYCQDTVKRCINGMLRALTLGRQDEIGRTQGGNNREEMQLFDIPTTASPAPPASGREAPSSQDPPSDSNTCAPQDVHTPRPLRRFASHIACVE